MLISFFLSFCLTFQLKIISRKKAARESKEEEREFVEGKSCQRRMKTFLREEREKREVRLTPGHEKKARQDTTRDQISQNFCHVYSVH
jgi:hypothetical protein